MAVILLSDVDHSTGTAEKDKRAKEFLGKNLLE
jgi:hypothetical protein